LHTMFGPNIYEGSIFRPPSEAYSLILQATIGCSWNRCTFCIAFQEKEFRGKSLEELKADVEAVFSYHKDTTRIFLADGNALALPTDTLESMLKYLYKKFKRLERVTIYGGPLDIKKKTVTELKRLKKAGLSMIYFGLESGSDAVLRLVRKGVNSKTMIETGQKVKRSGIPLSVIWILGLGGKALTEEHALETARVITAQDPDYGAALTLMVEPGTQMKKDVKSGKIVLLSPEEALVELRLTIEKINTTNMLFRANHASNYVTFRGVLAKDKDRMIKQIDAALDEADYKPESMRRL